jgi:hypothetical protein
MKLRFSYDLGVANLLYLLLNHKKLRNVLNSVTKRGVLILGRFGDGGLDVLQGIAKSFATLVICRLFSISISQLPAIIVRFSGLEELLEKLEKDVILPAEDKARDRQKCLDNAFE